MTLLDYIFYIYVIFHYSLFVKIYYWPFRYKIHIYDFKYETFILYCILLPLIEELLLRHYLRLYFNNFIYNDIIVSMIWALVHIFNIFYIECDLSDSVVIVSSQVVMMYIFGLHIWKLKFEYALLYHIFFNILGHLFLYLFPYILKLMYWKHYNTDVDLNERFEKLGYLKK